MTPEPKPVPSLDELMADPSLALRATPEQAERLLLALAPIEEGLRLAAARPAPGQGQPAEQGDRLLSPEEVAAILGKPRHSVYGLARRADWQAFTLRINRKTLRFRESGFRRWLGRQSRGSAAH